MKWLALLPLPFFLLAQSEAPSLGILEGHQDVGTVLHPGSVAFDAAKQQYTVSASGENLWGTADAFQFAWKKMSGDVVLAADVSFPETGGDPHKKAVIMMRQSLDADAAYADVALHGNGLTSLQAREAKGAATHEVQSNLSAPQRLSLVKIGRYFYMRLGDSNSELAFAGGGLRVPLEEPFYVGIGVSAHNKDATEKAVFSHVTAEMTPPPAGQPKIYSTLETVTVSSTDRRVSYVAPQYLQSPSWSKDGNTLTFLRNGKRESVPVAGGNPTLVPLTEVRVAEKIGLSPDGKSRVFIQKRGGQTDLYMSSGANGLRTRLTNTSGINDGPEFSPDGKYIYFHSNRTGTMQIWRVLADGTQPEQLTSDNLNNCFPHVSPDGSRISFLSYGKNIQGYPILQDVAVRMLTLETKQVKDLAKLLGGTGSLDAPSWSPDSQHLALISYMQIQ